MLSRCTAHVQRLIAKTSKFNIRSVVNLFLNWQFARSLLFLIHIVVVVAIVLVVISNCSTISHADHTRTYTHTAVERMYVMRAIWHVPNIENSLLNSLSSYFQSECLMPLPQCYVLQSERAQIIQFSRNFVAQCLQLLQWLTQ